MISWGQIGIHLDNKINYIHFEVINFVNDVVLRMNWEKFQSGIIATGPKGIKMGKPRTSACQIAQMGIFNVQRIILLWRIVQGDASLPATGHKGVGKEKIINLMLKSVLINGLWILDILLDHFIAHKAIQRAIEKLNGSARNIKISHGVIQIPNIPQLSTRIVIIDNKGVFREPGQSGHIHKFLKYGVEGFILDQELIFLFK